ncbi:nicotinate-nucleotide--dimethylbenzimidazole phosphoribosyltransferase [Eubacterium oxidoreducens]|uniref:Nicotinate-nucleotide--dimethylbenzimidazole phosphoribosyltransferase n=1 Tax=Eubacterium oxidoreducens TaxID=1732 RepID=A0A1G6BI48_EUBOX|nr:nicotinate-nucleotide--dimethylbenzimidazole phosphoribosyltransferase [Eubacterium oxidoreducens]SDB20276.1 nicotinate-nucleotide-dimethylbenzimidazole phosphoribosyltransferase [Eubacterium oxidoreducens]
MEELERIKNIEPIDWMIYKKIQQHFDKMGKPLRSLGKMETIMAQIGAIERTEQIDISRKGLIIMCADNGVVEEGVTQTGQEVTGIVAENFLDEKSCVAIMCKRCKVDLFPIDIGMVKDTRRVEKRKKMYGTKNLAKGPAMNKEQAVYAICQGINLVKELREAGYKILATGEMGIGNTTTSSAVASVLLQKDPKLITGRGAGLSTEGLQRKIAAIEQGIKVNKPDAQDPIDVLRKVGGLDIAGLSGVFLGGAIYGIPVLIDGFISAVAALVATRINPLTKEYMIASHISKEPAMTSVLQALEKEAMLTMDMSLGEGSGAVATFPILDMAADIYYNMSSFDEIGVDTYRPLI